MKDIPKILTNPRTWIGLAILMVAIAIYRNGPRWWQQLKRRDLGNYTGQEPVKDNPAREAELQQMAADTYTALHSVLMLSGVTATGREFQLELLLGLNDTELRYVARYYENTANPEGVSLKQDVNDEWMPFSDVKQRLVSRLNKLAL